jgi:hypothetical protein
LRKVGQLSAAEFFRIFPLGLQSLSLDNSARASLDRRARSARQARRHQNPNAMMQVEAVLNSQIGILAIGAVTISEAAH